MQIELPITFKKVTSLKKEGRVIQQELPLQFQDETQTTMLDIIDFSSQMKS